MFGWIKGRARKRDDDFGDIRSEILTGRSYDPPQPSSFQQPQQQVPSRTFDDFTPKTREIFEPIETPSFTSSFDKPAEPPSRSYELIDRLNIMESQLAAIRSMTETINERLKNLESKLGMQRRY